MTWWGWWLLWAVLVAGSVTVHVLLLRRVWHGVKAVGHELGELTRRIEQAGLNGPVDTH